MPCTLEGVSACPSFTVSSSPAASAGRRFVELLNGVTFVPLPTTEDGPVASGKKKLDLFSVDDVESVSYYTILGGLPFFCTPDEVKKAYHIACLTYHPDKSGRDEEDPVFLTVKKAFDTLSDRDKKRAYDSSANFDDSIPSKDLPERKFYAAYGEVRRKQHQHQTNEAAERGTLNLTHK